MIFLPFRVFTRFSIVLFLVLVGACREEPTEPVASLIQSPTTIFPPVGLIPLPESVQAGSGSFVLKGNAIISVESATEENKWIASYLAEKLNDLTGYSVTTATAEKGGIILTMSGADAALGNEGYSLSVTDSQMKLTAYNPEGLFRGVQTIRQLLAFTLDSISRDTVWGFTSLSIQDRPRYEWRGAMLDVARHFFGVSDVKRFIDLMAYYKLNTFHIHLTDDQGWRIEIKSWNKLTTIGGNTSVGGGAGGFFTQNDYAEIVRYAQQRYITIIPEIDMPGHMNAALASYAELNCSGTAPPMFTGIEVGFSSLCINKPITYTFVDDVVRELSGITPGKYIHIGGDEAHSTPAADYVRFIDSVQAIVKKYNKRVIGWEEIAQGNISSPSLIQHWNSTIAQQGVAKGAKVIMSPATKAYLDMKYDKSTTLGQDWAALIDVWDPSTTISGVNDTHILGLEAPLWTETILTTNDIDYMTFPRLIGYAEIGWSSQGGREWDEYKYRLGAQGARLARLGINFYRSDEVPWE
ncbi:MAG: beta-N-acetylhexosaminidase [Ignavibacteriales bacterium]|nr:beta-N-acetylhexosaminidase [Ignavibacteriales bacterium]